MVAYTHIYMCVCMQPYTIVCRHHITDFHTYFEVVGVHAHSMYSYIYVTGVEIGFWNLQDGLCIAVKGDRPRMPMDTQACWHNCTLHAQRFSHLQGRTDDCDIIKWYHHHYAYIEVRGLYKGAHMSPGAIVWVFGCSTFSCTSLGATDPLLWLPQCLSRSETITLQGSVLYLFNCKCPKVILGTLS